MIVETSRKFDKHYKNRIKKNHRLDKKARKRILLFTSNHKHYLLKNHSLTGSKKHLRAFSVTGNFRIIYQKIDHNKVLLVDIGTHNQVY